MREKELIDTLELFLKKKKSFKDLRLALEEYKLKQCQTNGVDVHLETESKPC